jgi:hypothetical protein
MQLYSQGQIIDRERFAAGAHLRRRGLSFVKGIKPLQDLHDLC